MVVIENHNFGLVQVQEEVEDDNNSDDNDEPNF
jgi:hypothetical protein